MNFISYIKQIVLGTVLILAPQALSAQNATPQAGCYLRLHISEKSDGSFKLTQIDNLFGTFGASVQAYDPTGGPADFIEVVYTVAAKKRIVGRYYFISQRFVIGDTFNSDAGPSLYDRGDAPSLVYIPYPYLTTIAELRLIDASGKKHKLIFDPKSIKCENSCLKVGAQGKFGSAICCEPLQTKSQPDGSFVCTK